jgi:hypothetical protein
VVVERAFAQPDGLTELDDAGAVVAVLSEEPCGNVEDLLLARAPRARVGG